LRTTHRCIPLGLTARRVTVDVPPEEPSKHSEPQPTKSIAQAAEDLLVDTLVAGMVPRVTEMLKLDVEEDRMPSEEDAQTELSAEKQEEEAAQVRADH
jgi:hypothetical protein